MTATTDRMQALLAGLDRNTHDSSSDTSLQQLYLLIESLCAFYQCFRARLEESDVMRRDLEETKKELAMEKAKEKKGILTCSSCAELQRELHTHKKRLKDNRLRIQTIARILQDTQDEEQDGAGNCRHAMDLVSQMLLGADVDPMPCTSQQPPTAWHGAVTEDSSEELVPCTPQKQMRMAAAAISPVLGSGTKRAAARAGPATGDSDASSPSLMEHRLEPHEGECTRRRADFWQLKTTHTVDPSPNTGRRKGRRCLKQAHLSLQCHPKRHDLADMGRFIAGVRPGAVSTQVGRSGEGDMDDDIVVGSPQAAPPKTGKLKMTLTKASFNDPDATLFAPTQAVQACMTTRTLHTADMESSFDVVPGREADVPDFKYRGGTVRKKAERRELPGWECNDCERYFKAAGHERMNTCSRHRDHFPVRPVTPPGFWDADFPSTQECQDRNLDVTIS